MITSGDTGRSAKKRGVCCEPEKEKESRTDLSKKKKVLKSKQEQH